MRADKLLLEKRKLVCVFKDKLEQIEARTYSSGDFT